MKEIQDKDEKGKESVRDKRRYYDFLKERNPILQFLVC